MPCSGNQDHREDQIEDGEIPHEETGHQSERGRCRNELIPQDRAKTFGRPAYVTDGIDHS
jgi:hypothetical protein